jgi:hypothetical protein
MAFWPCASSSRAAQSTPELLRSYRGAHLQPRATVTVRETQWAPIPRISPLIREQHTKWSTQAHHPRPTKQSRMRRALNIQRMRAPNPADQGPRMLLRKERAQLPGILGARNSLPDHIWLSCSQCDRGFVCQRR